MNLYNGNTDYNWFNYLRSLNAEDINFQQPGGKLHFHAINPGAPFLFRLKSPVNKIAQFDDYNVALCPPKNL